MLRIRHQRDVLCKRHRIFLRGLPLSPINRTQAATPTSNMALKWILISLWFSHRIADRWHAAHLAIISHWAMQIFQTLFLHTISRYIVEDLAAACARYLTAISLMVVSAFFLTVWLSLYKSIDLKERHCTSIVSVPLSRPNFHLHRNKKINTTPRSVVTCVCISLKAAPILAGPAGSLLCTSYNCA